MRKEVRMVLVMLGMSIGLVFFCSNNILGTDRNSQNRIIDQNIILDDDDDDDKNLCSKNKVAGSYTRTLFVDGGASPKTYLDQINLGREGTVYWFSVSGTDRIINLGGITPFVGSWKCRRDGTVLMNIITATLAPFVDPGSGINDIDVRDYLRFTIVFSIEDKDTLKRVQSVGRFMPASNDENPADPDVGTIFGVGTSPYFLKRFKPLESDLNIP